jgi:hypothetical protein
MTISFIKGAIKMDNQVLMDIRNNLDLLPVLNARLDKFNEDITLTESNINSLLKKYENESLDVDRLKRDSLSATIYKMIGKYEGKVDKETEEMYRAKLEYDKERERLLGLTKTRFELVSRIKAIEESKSKYEIELLEREEQIKRDISSEAYKEYSMLESERKRSLSQIVETEEALRVANNVLSSAENAVEHLSSAERWATYDVWSRGGIFSHMAKYDHIDNAQESSNRLNSQLKDLRKELADVDLSMSVNFAGVDSTTRAIDFWFDNIFTDLNVRDQIRDDLSSISNLKDAVQDIAYKLDQNKSSLQNKLFDLDKKIQDLIINSPFV